MNITLQERIFNQIRDDINDKIYKTGERLPSENALAQTFNTTRMTVRNALMRLSDEGYIYSVACKGYFVKEKKYNQYLFQYDEIMIMDKTIEKIKLVSVDIIKPDVDLSYNLRLPGDSRIVAIKHILYKNNQKIAYIEKFIPYFSGMPIIESEINYATLPEIIGERTSLFSMKKSLIIKIVESDESLMRIFELNETMPMFRVEQTIIDDEGEPMGWEKITYLMDYFCINAELIVNK